MPRLADESGNPIRAFDIYRLLPPRPPPTLGTKKFNAGVIAMADSSEQRALSVRDRKLRAAAAPSGNNPLWVITVGMAVFFAVMLAILSVG
jgi:hypothetical protein